MNLQKLDQRQHMVLALGLLIACLIVVFAGVIWPAVSSRLRFYEAVDDMQFQYTRFSRVAAQTDMLRQEVVRLKKQQDDLTGFLDEKPEALAAADLQKQIKILVEENKGNLISTQVVQSPEQSVTQSPFPQIHIQVHMRGDIEVLKKLLYQVASSNVVLLINDVHVQSRQRRGRRRQLEEELLEIRFSVTGFMYKAVGNETGTD